MYFHDLRHGNTGGYKGLQGLQGVKRGYMGLEGVTGGDKGLQEVAKDYRNLFF